MKSFFGRWRRPSARHLFVASAMLCIALFANDCLMAQTSINVGSSSDLLNAIQTINSNPNSSYTLNFISGFTMSQQVPDITSQSQIVLAGNSNSIDGNNAYQPLVINSGDVVIQNLNIINSGSPIKVNAGNLIDTTGSLAGPVINNGGVVLNEPGSYTYSGIMSGTGQVDINSVGPVTFSGANTYTGGTIVQASSTLIGTTDSLIGSFTNSGTLQFSAGTNGGYNVATGKLDAAGTYSGDITGTGNVVISGTGSVTFSGTNSYSGGTKIDLGSSLIGTTSSLQGAITNNGDLNFSQATNGTYAGNISGTGQVEVSGTGQVKFSGLSTYTGGTIVDNKSTLIGTTDSLIGSITNNGTLQFSAGTNGGYNVGTGKLDPIGTYTGNITGAGGVEISGSGPVTFSGQNSYTGGTLIDAGSTLIGTTSSLHGTLFNNGTVQLTQPTSGTYAGAITGTGSLEISGGSAITLTALNSYTGGTVIDHGSSLIGTTDSLVGNIKDNGSLRFSAGTYGGYNTGTGNLDPVGVYSGKISGTGSVEISGAGPMMFTGANTYSGGTLIDVGSSLYGTTSSLQGTITNNGYVNFDQSTNGTFAGAMSGSGRVEIGGGGQVTFSGLNTYTGGTTIDNGSTLITTTSNLTGPITNNYLLEFNQTPAGTYAGNISGTGGVEITGSGAVTLSGQNSYQGGTLVNSGSTLIGTTSSVQGIVINNGAVQLDQATSGTYAGQMAGKGSLEISGGGTVTLTGLNSYTGGTLIDSGSKLIGTTDSLVGNINDLGSLQISAGTIGGFNVNTGKQDPVGIFSGNITGAGTVEISGSKPLMLTGTNNYSGGTLVDTGSSLYGTTSSLQGAITNNGNVNFNQSTTGTYAGKMSGTGSVDISGGGQVTFTGVNSYTGGTTIDNGSTLVTATNNLTGPITNNYVLEFNQTTAGTYAGNISGAGILEILGTGAVTLSGLNTYHGGTYIDTGSTLIGTTSSVQGVLIDNGAVQFLQSTSGTDSNVITGVGSVEISGGGTVTLTGLNSYSGGTTVDSGSKLIGTTDSLAGNINDNGSVQFSSGTLGGYNFNTGKADPIGTYSGNIGGSGSVEISGSGPVTFTGTNSYTGGTLIDVNSSLIGTTTSLQGAITNNGSVNFNQTTMGSYAGNMTGSGGVVISGSGQVLFTGTNSYTGGTVVDSGSTLGGSATGIQGAIDNNGSIIFNRGSNGTFAGKISGAGSVEISNSLGLTFTGANTYSGGTIVDANSTLTGTTTSLQGGFTNDGTVSFLQSTNGMYAGNMTGSGNVIVGGGGTINFAGTNSYTGGTTINSGTTLVGLTSGLQGNFTNNGTLIFNQNPVNIPGFSLLALIEGIKITPTPESYYTGAISGTGGVQFNGGGAFSLSGTNTYTGGTTVASGTAVLGTTTSLQGKFVNNGVVDFIQNSTGTYAGNMSGTGALVIDSPGAITLSGTNSYTGGTTITNVSTLIGTTNSLQGVFQDSGLLVFNQTTAGTFAGAISGTGAVDITGLGPITFTGVNNYTGGTVIGNGSTLIVGPTGSIGDVTIDNGGTLQGEGTIGAVTVNAGGTLYPGTVGAPLTINGPFTQGTGSTYTAEISPTASDKIIVTGAATIKSGTTLNLNIDPGVYTVGTKYDVLSAAGGIAGKYSTQSTSSYTQDIIFTQHYGTNDLTLTVKSDLLNFAQTPNQAAVASLLDQASGTATGNFATAITQLTTLSPGRLAGALNQVSGDIYPSLSSIQRQTTTMQLQLLSNRLAGLSGPGIPAVTAQSRQSGVRLVSSQSSDAQPSSPSSDAMNWSTWGQGYGLGGNIAGDGNAGGVNYRLGGTMFGVERWLGDGTLVGVLGGYASNSINNGQDGSNATVTTYQVGLYELHREDSFYVSNIDAFNNDNYSVTRPLSFGNFQATASGSSSGNEWAHYTEFGKTWDIDEFHLQPFAGLQYMYLNQRGFSESGAGSLDMTTSSQIVSSVRNAFGVRLSGETTWRDYMVVPFLSVQYQHEWGNGTQLITSSYSGMPTAQFAVAGTHTGRDFGLFTLGLTGFVNDRVSLYGTVDSQVAQGYYAVMGTGGFKFSW